jgi:hypothetical protein
VGVFIIPSTVQRHKDGADWKTVRSASVCNFRFFIYLNDFAAKASSKVEGKITTFLTSDAFDTIQAILILCPYIFNIYRIPHCSGQKVPDS